ncbi:MAG: hypothetical protein KF779_02560 [Hyphomonadaceae bacterium]|nr:hypothetical protein [Hyphomonadaceae bacterium]
MSRKRETLKARMRIGIFVDTSKLRGWRKAIFKRLLQAPDVRVAQIIAHDRVVRREGALWRAADALERALAKRLLHRPLARARGIDPAILDDGALDAFEYCDAPQAAASDRATILAAHLDAIVDLSAGANLDSNLARRGVWRIAAGMGTRDKLSPLGFWEFYHGAPVTEIAVLARAGADEKRIASGVYSGFMWSWSMNDLMLGLRAAAMLEDALKKDAAGQDATPTEPRRRSAFQAPVALLRTYARLALDGLERAFADDRWRVLLARGEPLAAHKAEPTVIESPPHSYWADPFVVVREGRCHLFFEEYLYAARRGVISHVCIENPQPGETLRDLKSTVIFDEPHHLSYPFLFTFGGDLFMIPESGGARAVEIWKATDFPHGWTRVARPLEDVTAADTSLLEWNGKWWLFTNIDRSGVNDHRSELHVFYADNPISGPWRPHAANPVVIDATCGRMAGGFLTAEDGRPIRCGQKQGRRYGEEVAYRLITDLTETTYAETPLSGVNPIPVAAGARTHHVSARDGMIVVDECFVVPKWKRRR